MSTPPISVAGAVPSSDEDAEGAGQVPAAGPPMPELRILTAADVLRQLAGHREECMDVVRRAYLCHSAGNSVNPESSFLRFPHRPEARIISLPAYLGGQFEVAGIKWIASYPGNRARSLPRASAVLLLNDTVSGYPFAAMEASIISASRTAASAVLAAEILSGGRHAARVGVVGAGLIADHVWRFLRDLHWEIDGFTVFDVDHAQAERFAANLEADGAQDIVVASAAADAFSGCNLVVVATVATEPHICDPALLGHAPVVLHLSLRDLNPAVILAAQNITDDIDHAVREHTSLHLTEQRTGYRGFIDGTLAHLLRGTLVRDPGRAAVFSPFGLGVLDLAVGQWVWSRTVAEGGGLAVPGFYGDAIQVGRNK